MVLRFGTDGVRGDADADLTTPLVVALGRAAARVLGTARPFAIGRDTRVSGRRIAADLTAGLRVEGADVVHLGVLPTPAVAFHSARADGPAAVISASHNPYADNGIKLFGPGGRKLDDATEAAVESELDRLLLEPTAGSPIGRVATLADAADAYIAHLVDALDGRDLGGLHVVVDCAHGAASAVAPRALRELGARVDVLHAEPDGTNINAGCGSTHPEALQAAVARAGAAAGLALDGDADRVLAVDERGDLVDGDQLMVIAALDLHARGCLRGDAVAVTVMSNLGLHRALAAAGIGVVETAVGDRSVLEAIEQRDLSLGGEQSGHVVFADLATTGDGTLTGILLLDRLRRAGGALSDLASVMHRVPQVLVNIAVGRRPDPAGDPALDAEIGAVAAELGDRGRVLVRPSGTEPVVRVMVEADRDDNARRYAERLRRAVVAAYGS